MKTCRVKEGKDIRGRNQIKDIVELKHHVEKNEKEKEMRRDEMRQVGNEFKSKT